MKIIQGPIKGQQGDKSFKGNNYSVKRFSSDDYEININFYDSNINTIYESILKVNKKGLIYKVNNLNELDYICNNPDEVQVFLNE